MAVIRQSEAVRLSEQAIALDLGDLRAQADAIIARAQADAQVVLNDARMQRVRIVTGAAAQGRAEGQAQGYAQGLAEGRAEGREEARAAHREALTKLEAGWAEGLQAFIRSRDADADQATQDVVALAVLLAERVVKRAIRVDPSLVVDQVKAAVRACATKTMVTIRVHPEDEAIVRESLPRVVALCGTGAQGAGEHVVLRADGAMARGSCVVRTGGGGEVDASIATQLDRIAVALLGERARTGSGSVGAQGSEAVATDGGDPQQSAERAP